jgi:hypothetical protein
VTVKRWIVLGALALCGCAAEKRYETVIPGSSVTDFDRGPTRSPQNRPGSPVGDQNQIGEDPPPASN